MSLVDHSYPPFVNLQLCKMSPDSKLHKIKAILEKIGIPTVFEIFKKEKIDLKVAVSLSDNELI